MKTADKPMRIFVVDDHRDVAEGLADVLRMHGHEVEVAFNGEQAIRTFREKDFDIAFMDVMMPGMNGVESFMEIRKIKPAAKVIMMTGYSVEQLLDQAVDKGAYGVLHKPVAMHDVLDAVERVKSQGMVLVADDDPDFSASIQDVLESRGYRVCLARTGSEALKTVLGGGVDILVLDLQLPVISGLEVYMQLRTRGRAVPTVVVTGHSEEQVEAIDTLRTVSSTGILTKPFASSQLFEEIERLVPPKPRSAAPSEAALQDAPRAAPEPQQPAVEEIAVQRWTEESMPQAMPETESPTDSSLKLEWPAEAAPEAMPAPRQDPVPDPVQAAPAADPAPREPEWQADPIQRAEPARSAPEPRPAPPQPSQAYGAASMVPPSMDRDKQARAGRIIAVDDDVDMVEGLAEVLRTRGYEVLTANDADTAKELIQQFDAQVALLDIRLGKTNGLELIPVMKAERPHVYCVMITGNADKESAITALRIGAYDYLTKPLHPSELFAILDRCLEKSDLQKRLDQAFEDLQSAKNHAEAISRSSSEFLAKLTEELALPVGEIINSSKVFVEEAWGPLGAAQYGDHAQGIRDNASQILDTLKCSLDLAKAQAGTLEINEDRFDIGALATSVGRLVTDSVDAATPEIGIQAAGSLPMVWGDERHFEHLLLNLLSNAVKFTPEDGEIKVTLDLDHDGSLVIEVCDTGIGMPPSEIPTALAQFGRVDNPGGRKFPGSGLGLPLVAAVAELHGGRLTLESDLGKGTIASVVIPAERVDRELLAGGTGPDTSVGLTA